MIKMIVDDISKNPRDIEWRLITEDLYHTKRPKIITINLKALRFYSRD